MEKYFDIEELAVFMGISPLTIRRNLAYKPFNLPPKMHIPGSKMMRWRKVEVEKWLWEHGKKSAEVTKTARIKTTVG